MDIPPLFGSHLPLATKVPLDNTYEEATKFSSYSYSQSLEFLQNHFQNHKGEFSH